MTTSQDQLRRAQHVLETARQEYDALSYVVLEDLITVTVHSRQRSASLPVSGEVVGHLMGYLSEFMEERIKRLEDEVARWHGEVADEALGVQQDAAELSEFRAAARSAPPTPTG